MTQLDLFDEPGLSMPPLCAWRSRKANIMGVIDNPDFTSSKLIELVPKNSVEFSPDRRVIKVPFRDKWRPPFPEATLERLRALAERRHRGRAQARQ